MTLSSPFATTTDQVKVLVAAEEKSVGWGAWIWPHPQLRLLVLRCLAKQPPLPELEGEARLFALTCEWWLTWSRRIQVRQQVAAEALGFEYPTDPDHGGPWRRDLWRWIYEDRREWITATPDDALPIVVPRDWDRETEPVAPDLADVDLSAWSPGVLLVIPPDQVPVMGEPVDAHKGAGARPVHDSDEPETPAELGERPRRALPPGDDEAEPERRREPPVRWREIGHFRWSDWD